MLKIDIKSKWKIFLIYKNWEFIFEATAFSYIFWKIIFYVSWKKIEIELPSEYEIYRNWKILYKKNIWKNKKYERKIF